MIAKAQTADLQSFALQGQDHLQALQRILGCGEPPEQSALQQLKHMTRSLRGSASLLGLDVFQSFLGRLFSLLEDVESSEVPWSARLEVLLDEAHQCAAAYLQMLERGSKRPRVDALLRVEERLASWRRETARRFETPVGRDESQHMAPRSDGWQHVLRDLDTLVLLAREVQARAAAAHAVEAPPEAVVTRARELAVLGAAMAEPAVPPVVPAFEDGLRNHCEGVLRSLVESAAQEVLDEARERGSRLALRATGSLGEVDDELGGALLEILRNLWSDSLLAQHERSEAEIDCIVRVDEDRIVVEVRDPAVSECSPLGEDDVLGRYPGLRRSRPLVESLQGLVWVESRGAPGCRFRIALPRSTKPTAAQVIHVGAHAVALPAPAVEAVHVAAAVRVLQDGNGPVVDVDGSRIPMLQLAVALQDPSFEELERELVVVLGSFERRAAMFASGPCAAVHGTVEPAAHRHWLGTLATKGDAVPLLDVAALLGRRRTAAPRREAAAKPAPKAGRTVLVVSSAATERQRLIELLGDGSRTLGVQSATEGWEVLGRERVDLLICDLRLPEMNAQRLAELRRQTGEHADVPVLLVLSQGGEQSHLVVRQLGAQGFVSAGVERDELLQAVRQCSREARV